MKSLRIILRTCAVVKTLSSTADRPFGLDKQTMILASLRSLIESCSSAKGVKIRLDIVDDSSPLEFRAKMKSILDSSGLIYELHKIEARNNGKSLAYCYDLASGSKADVIYFCEDDYLHLPDEVPFIVRAYNEKIIGSDKFVIHPTDYPDRYVRVYPSYIFLSSDCHWRSVQHTTGTFYIPTSIFKKYKNLYYKFAEINSGKIGGGEDATINKVYQSVPCLSPIPSLAAHLNDDTLPPFIDWKSEVKKFI